MRAIGIGVGLALGLVAATATAQEATEGYYGTYDDENEYLQSTLDGSATVIAGSLSVVATYFFSVPLVGMARGDGNRAGLAAIPIAGPWIAVGTMQLPDALPVGLVLNGIGQLAGLGVIAYGLAVMQWEVEVREHATRLEIRVDGDEVTLGGSF